MYFVLSKTVGFLAVPSNLLVLLSLAGVVLMGARFVRAGRALAATGIALLAVAGLSPLGNALILPLEQRFPPWRAGQGVPDGIIVLGGAIGPTMSAARGETQLNEAAERMTVVAALARQFPQARIVFSGGDPSLAGGGPSEAVFVVPMLESFGIPASRVELEGASRNTHENAVFTKELVKPKPGERWLLVTSAHHMPRSVGCFRRAGFAVEPYPVDWRTRGLRDLASPFGTVSAGLARTDVAVREWVGLVTYRLTGRMSELFPGPRVTQSAAAARAGRRP
jgi:uncharacterized SAM-binding protein YcdF (DUF218 family)